MISRSRTVKPAPESGDKLTRFGSVQLAMPRPEVLDILVQCRRDSRSALRLMRKLLKRRKRLQALLPEGSPFVSEALSVAGRGRELQVDDAR